jgi:hypothetical protein
LSWQMVNLLVNCCLLCRPRKGECEGMEGRMYVKEKNGCKEETTDKFS